MKVYANLSPYTTFLLLCNTKEAGTSGRNVLDGPQVSTAPPGRLRRSDCKEMAHN